jgi:hypothetical protein
MSSQTTQTIRIIAIALVLAMVVGISAAGLSVFFDSSTESTVCQGIVLENLREYGSRSDNLTMNECYQNYGTWEGDNPLAGYCNFDNGEKCYQMAADSSNQIFTTILAVLSIAAIFTGFLAIKSHQVKQGFIFGGILAFAYCLSMQPVFLVWVFLVLMLAALIWAAYKDETSPNTKKSARKR